MDKQNLGIFPSKTQQNFTIHLSFNLLSLLTGEKNLPDFISLIRKQLYSELGFYFPPTEIYDNKNLENNTYIIKIKDEIVSKQIVYPDKLFIIPSKKLNFKKINFDKYKVKFNNLYGIWINTKDLSDELKNNSLILDSISLIISDIAEIVRDYADELFTYQELEKWLQDITPTYEKLIQDFKINNFLIKYILKSLLKEKISILDKGEIIENIAESLNDNIKDKNLILEKIRIAINKRFIPKISNNQVINAFYFDYIIYELINQINIQNEIKKEIENFKKYPIIILAPLKFRKTTYDYLTKFFKNLFVLKFEEVPENYKIKLKKLNIENKNIENKIKYQNEKVKFEKYLKNIL